MSVENNVGNLLGVKREVISENASVVASNIERYLNNHIREGSHSWKMNMAARRIKRHTHSEGTPSQEIGSHKSTKLP